MTPLAEAECVRPFVDRVPAVEATRDQSRSVTETRYGFIDLLRGFAIVVMIETHVVSSYLPLIVKKGSSLFFWVSFVNGLVAPAFLFAAGFSLALQSDRHWDYWLRLRLPFWKQMRRLGFIALVAYYCHLQGFKLSRYFSHWGDSLMWKRTLQVDVLQCVVVSLLVVHALIFFVRHKELLPWGAGILAAVAALITPWMWSQDFGNSVPLAFALFLNPHGISLFPIFPWICFVLAGTCASCIFMNSVRSNRVMRFMQGIAVLGAVMIACGVLLRDVPFSLPGHVNFYRTSPLYIMIRTGCVLLVCSLLYILETKTRWTPRLIQLAGRESLLVYGVHLWLIYAVLRGRRIGPLLGLQLGWTGCMVLSLLIIISMLFLARFWHDLKNGYPKQVRYAQFAIVLVMISVFVLN